MHNVQITPTNVKCSCGFSVDDDMPVGVALRHLNLFKNHATCKILPPQVSVRNDFSVRCKCGFYFKATSNQEAMYVAVQHLPVKETTEWSQKIPTSVLK